MQLLTFPFLIISLCGLWCPDHWSPRNKTLYFVYTCVIVVGSISLFISQSSLLFLTEINFKFISDIMYTLLTSLTIFIKEICLIFKKENIMRLDNMLSKNYCIPRNRREVILIEKSSYVIKLSTILLDVMVVITAICWFTIPLLQNDTERHLPYAIWVPYDLNVSRNYWITYGCEITAIEATIFNGAVDSLIYGFIFQACVQLDILIERVRDLPQKVIRVLADETSLTKAQRIEKDILGEIIRHHNYIIEYVNKVIETFEFVIMAQFLNSAFILSIIIYQLSINPTANLQALMDIMYFGCMLLEFLGFCYFGNELTLKFENFATDIYEADWVPLTSYGKKLILQIMIRTKKPITITCKHFLRLDLNSFKSILKISYTAYNVLKEGIN